LYADVNAADIYLRITPVGLYSKGLGVAFGSIRGFVKQKQAAEI
jgi:hypothetical protein